jgi:transaldolase
MALLLDSIDVDEITTAMELGIFAGVTTNPKLLAGVPKGEHLERLAEIARACPGSLYAQVDHGLADLMEHQALTLREVALGRTVIKVPMGREGLVLVGRMRPHQVPVCLTAVFSAAQAAAAGAAGASAVAIYVARIDKSGRDGLQVVADAAALLAAGGHRTRVLAASIPDAQRLVQILKVPGIDATIPASLIPDLLDQPGTQQAIDEFTAAADAAMALGGDNDSDPEAILRSLED